ncbi:MAG: hypothetical protein KJ955_04070 [Nanoarchaeota archaeon]|nr:hypothetical protein [Nanoarchaeota archaeon]
MAEESDKIKQLMGKELGTLVLLYLVDETNLNVQTTLTPTYHKKLEGVDDNEETSKSFVGYVAHIDDEQRRVHLAPGWDYDQKRPAGLGSIGMVRFDFDVIEHITYLKPY